MLLIPILLPMIGGVFVFRQRNEKIRNRLVLWLTIATAAAAATLCVLPERSLRLMTIEGALYLEVQSDSLAKFFMVLIVVIWLPVAVFTGAYLRHAGRGQQFQGFYTMTLGVLMGLALADNFVTLYMQDAKNGRVRDFVAVGDVEIKAIGADEQILDSEVPIRQILEQVVAKTGIPPFMGRG